ncbi:putative ubiquitin carboxyl-terminal hydrolase 2 [Calycina marina]|uniref:ubiquitinyl hydrolase 1 n=1 Tax=Calycina marina TaxID=1763456 RepID=A0A9P7Z213_9HELO|nr:putative ubiquitin carboxyl-terminal hydrolase 2 [Calycina marina]
MAGPGGGLPRRSHTKSRKGCETCKRRHIRCDESFPQCRNCTKHNCRCPYMDMPVQEERQATPERADLLWTPEIEAEIERWQQSGVFPFPDLFIYPVPSTQFFSFEDLRLIHHVASVSSELGKHDASRFTIWTRQMPLCIKIGAQYNFVMHALLALSASHLAWLTDCPLTANMAIEHRGMALKGLHEAIGAFSRQNSDAVLAASLLLSWQATEWRGWTQLMHGTSSVIDAMQPWKNESQFGDFIAEQSTFPTAPPSPIPNATKLTNLRKADLDSLHRVYAQLRKVEAHLKDNSEDVKAIQQLMNFIRSVQKVTPNHTAAQRFEMLNPLQAWLFWLPVMFLQQTRGSPSALIILAHYYTTALVVEPMFPEVGAAYFGSLSVGPIEEIARRLFSINFSQNSEPGPTTPLNLMEYPIDMVTKFRSRMGWVQPERTASFPTFSSNPFALEDDFVNTLSPYGNPAFTYSQEHLMTMPLEPMSTTATRPRQFSSWNPKHTNNTSSLSRRHSNNFSYNNSSTHRNFPATTLLAFPLLSIRKTKARSAKHDSGVFTFLLDNLGVKDVQFEELIALDADCLRQLSPVYGVIFLFKYPTDEKANTDGTPKDGQYDYAAAENMFFAAQTIQNACGTQALLSVLLNKDGEIDVGTQLRDFKEFTSGFPAEFRGEALSNSELIRDVHNSFAKSSPFVDETQRTATHDDDVYHFIAYTPINGILYELDGLQPAPIAHGASTFEEFPEKVIPVLQKRIERYPANEIRFNLLAMVKDLRMKAREIGDMDMLMREEAKRNDWQFENSLRRHNFVGFAGEILKGVITSKLKKGPEAYEKWIDEAKKATNDRAVDRKKGGAIGDGDDEMTG